MTPDPFEWAGRIREYAAGVGDPSRQLTEETAALDAAVAARGPEAVALYNKGRQHSKEILADFDNKIAAATEEADKGTLIVKRRLLANYADFPLAQYRDSGACALGRVMRVGQPPRPASGPGSRPRCGEDLSRVRRFPAAAAAPAIAVHRPSAADKSGSPEPPAEERGREAIGMTGECGEAVGSGSMGASSSTGDDTTDCCECWAF